MSHEVKNLDDVAQGIAVQNTVTYYVSHHNKQGWSENYHMQISNHKLFCRLESGLVCLYQEITLCFLEHMVYTW